MARAFIREPRLLILDDTTSAVDAMSERYIQTKIAENFKQSTKIIVSSKLSSIRHANQILVLENGEMVGIGTHEQLLSTNAIYQEIAETQRAQGGMLHE